MRVLLHSAGAKTVLLGMEGPLALFSYSLDFSLATTLASLAWPCCRARSCTPFYYRHAKINTSMISGGLILL